jgi:uncharacterized Zn finger protein
MTDTELFIRCPWCAGEAREVPELYKTGYKIELPGDAAVEVRYRVYRCNECGRTFSELEGKDA